MRVLYTIILKEINSRTTNQGLNRLNIGLNRREGPDNSKNPGQQKSVTEKFRGE